MTGFLRQRFTSVVTAKGKIVFFFYNIKLKLSLKLSSNGAYQDTYMVNQQTPLPNLRGCRDHSEDIPAVTF